MASFSDLRESIIFQNFTFLISLIIFLRLFYKDALKKWIPLSSIYIFNINLSFDFYHNFLSQMESSYQKLSFHFSSTFLYAKNHFSSLKKPETSYQNIIFNLYLVSRNYPFFIYLYDFQYLRYNIITTIVSINKE